LKKLKLTVDDLEVSSFTAQDGSGQAGTVNGLQITGSFNCNTNPPRTGGQFTCVCTVEVDCYQSRYCSGPGCLQTYWETCETSNEYQC
jgi:hypothetical protein